LGKNPEKLEYSDFWDELSDHVKGSVDRGLKQSAAGETIPHEEVMKKFSKGQSPQTNIK
jgi:predicted transcriptional regulator